MIVDQYVGPADQPERQVTTGITVHALLVLYETTHDVAWLDWARELADDAYGRFAEVEIVSYGNVLASTAFLRGLAADELFIYALDLTGRQLLRIPLPTDASIVD